MGGSRERLGMAVILERAKNIVTRGNRGNLEISNQIDRTVLANTKTGAETKRCLGMLAQQTYHLAQDNRSASGDQETLGPIDLKIDRMTRLLSYLRLLLARLRHLSQP